MKRSHSESEFFARPAGSFLLAPGIAYWCCRLDLWGISMAGHTDDAVIERLVTWIDAESRHTYAPYVALLDFRAMRSMEASAFARFARFYVGHRARQVQRLRRAALVRPEHGLAATIVAGIVPVLAPLVPVATFVSVSEALAALDVGDEAALTAQVNDLRDLAAAPESLVAALRALLAPQVEAAPCAAAFASRLGVSLRTLQRHLTAAGTNFEAEVRAARVRHAQRLLAETDDKLGTVALAAGFSTQAHFNVVFQRLVGESPGSFRRRARTVEGSGRE